ncbi:hypothetical protein Emag_005063 [Eimeria magna]
MCNNRGCCSPAAAAAAAQGQQQLQQRQRQRQSSSWIVSAAHFTISPAAAAAAVASCCMGIAGSVQSRRPRLAAPEKLSDNSEPLCYLEPHRSNDQISKSLQSFHPVVSRPPAAAAAAAAAICILRAYQMSLSGFQPDLYERQRDHLMHGGPSAWVFLQHVGHELAQLSRVHGGDSRHLRSSKLIATPFSSSSSGSCSSCFVSSST